MKRLLIIGCGDVGLRVAMLLRPRHRIYALVRDAAGRRLAKRDGAESLRALREKGFSAEQVLALVEAG